MGKERIMKIFMTGYSGFLGHYLAQALIDQGCSLRVLLHRHGVNKKEMTKNIEIIWGSIDDRDLIRDALIGIDAVIHSAWSFSAPGDKRPTINERAASILLSESLHARIKKFAFISSVAVYGMSHYGDSPIQEELPRAHGRGETFIYPSEKIAVEKMLLEDNKGLIALGIFRPGPIIDSKKGPLKKILNIGPWHLGIGIGSGRNLMAYIHAQDVADAVLRWLLYGNDSAIFNVVPSIRMNAREWSRLWSLHNGTEIRPVFLPSGMFYLVQLGAALLKKSLGKESRSDIKYAIACATRNISYSNTLLKDSLNWSDTATAELIQHKPL